MEIVVGGQTTFVATGGREFDPSKPCIVFIHGAGCDHISWVHQARWFAHHGWSVLAPDLPGHGRSAGTAPTSIAAMADWTESLMDAAGIAKAAVAGHSMGGAIALELAGRPNSRVTHLGLIGTAAAIPVGKALLEAAVNAPDAAYDMMTTWAHAPRARIGGCATPGIWLTGTSRRIFDRNAPGVLANDLALCNVWTSGKDSAARVACPAAVILGALDVMTPPKRGAELAALIKGARLTTLPSTGHMIMFEAPDACLDALIGLVSPKA